MGHQHSNMLEIVLKLYVKLSFLPEWKDTNLFVGRRFDDDNIARWKGRITGVLPPEEAPGNPPIIQALFPYGCVSYDGSDISWCRKDHKAYALCEQA